MSVSEDIKQTVRDAFGPWESGNSRPFFDLIADDVRWTVIGTTAASGSFTSKQQLIDHSFGPLLQRLGGELTTRFVDLACDGDKVFLRFTSSGRSASGIAYEQTYCWAMRYRDGRLTEIVVYLDTDLLRRVFE